jgi:hypothetical protein
MSGWKRVLLLNASAIIGIVISLFIVPGDTPFWLWETIAVVFLAACNVLLYFQQGRAKPRNSPSARTIIALMGFVLLIIDMIISRHYR